MTIPADIADITFTTTHRFVYRLVGLPNPYWGMTRSQTSNFSGDFDANDDTVFTLYDFWTESFNFKGFDTVASALFGNSY
mmetsp:Transcript_16987/g.2803  ORF Transcript_16987/g.2803 Transcript_16987/m.2803 type:complete len:80 (+) Transcript_16987:312-551(+)